MSLSCRWHVVVILLLLLLVFIIYFLYNKNIKSHEKKKQKLTINDATLQKIKKILVGNDVGITVSNNILQGLKKKYENIPHITLDDLKKEVSNNLISILKPHSSNLNFIGVKPPKVIVLIGNNGVGKTNFSVKLSNYLLKDINKAPKKILVTSLDFFRAGAWEQLRLLVEKNKKNNIDYLAPKGKNVKGHTYDSYIYAQNNNYDVLIFDTSGRIHTHDGLMAEIAHINNLLVSMKSNFSTILVLDNNFGSMAISSYESFLRITNISGIVVTKTDSGCGGGWLIKLVEQHPTLKIFGQVKGESMNSFDSFDEKYFSERILNWSEICE